MVHETSMLGTLDVDASLLPNSKGRATSASPTSSRYLTGRPRSGLAPMYAPDHYGGNHTYVGKNSTVILSKDGKVVAAWSSSRNGWRYP
jgi:hypothetical protein